MTKAAKTQYSEQEAAQELGISVERLRSLIRQHILRGEDEGAETAMPTLQRSDLLLLRILSSNAPVQE